MKKLLLKSSIFRFLERGTVVVTSLLLTPFLIDVLGTSNYGLWILVLSIMGWFNVIDLGFPQAVQRQIIQALELNDIKRVNIVFSTGLVLFTLLGLLAVLTLFGLAQVPAIFGVEGRDQITLVNILLVLSLKVLWGFMMNPFHGFFAGMLRFDIDANLSSLNAIVKALLVFWLIVDLNIWGAVAATLAADVLTNLLKLIYAKRLFPSLQFKMSLAKIAEIKALFSYSKHLVLNGIANTIGTKSAPVLITQLFDLPSLAIASIAGNLVMHTTAFVNSITGVFSPLFNKMVAQNKNMEKLFIQTTTINMFVSTVLLLSLLIFGKAFIILWVGIEFEYAAYILYFAVAASLFDGFSSNANNILLAQANHKLISILTICSVIIGLSLSISFGLQFGLIGVAIGGAINALLFQVFAKMALFRRYNDYRTSQLYIGLIKSFLLTFGLGYLGAYGVAWLNIDTWLELIIGSALSLPITLFICWVFLLDKALKSMLLNLVRDKIKSKTQSSPFSK